MRRMRGERCFGAGIFPLMKVARWRKKRVTGKEGMLKAGVSCE